MLWNPVNQAVILDMKGIINVACDHNQNLTHITQGRYVLNYGKSRYKQGDQSNKNFLVPLVTS